MFDLSIITINFNNAAGLEKTINSVLTQSSKNSEFLVVDGGSNDGSIDIIIKHAGNINYWISERDNGIYDAMNKGIMQASGNYLMFLNSGDYLDDNNVLEEALTFINKQPNTDVLYGDIVSVKNDKKSVWKHPEKVGISFLKNNNLNHQAALIKASLFKEFGLYPMDYKLAGDHWLFLKALVNDKEFFYLKSLLVNYEPNGIGAKRRGDYEAEMADMWSKLVPSYADYLVNNYTAVEYANTYPFLKNIVPIHHYFTYNKKKLLLFSILLIASFYIVKSLFSF